MQNRLPGSENQSDANASASSDPTPRPKRSEVRARRTRSTIYSLILLGSGCLILAVVGLFITAYPALALWVPTLGSQTQQTSADVQHPQLWAQVNIPKPAYTPTPGMLTVAEPSVSQPTVMPTSEAKLEVSIVQTQEFPTAVVDNLPSSVDNSQTVVDNSANNPVDNSQIAVDNTAITPTPTVDNPGTIFAQIVPDTPTAEYVASASSSSSTAGSASDAGSPSYSASGGEHWIDVNLSQQRVYAYEGDTVVNSFIVSTGTWQTPTVTGKYKVWIKLLSTPMSGPGYYLPDVPYVMYFYKGYGLHGTYWHNNFGTPMSHGCVNLSIPDAQWLYNFSSVGTVVNVHY